MEEIVVEVSAGEEFQFRIESTPTTGYLWEVSALPTGITLLASEFEKPPGTRAPGDPMIQCFRLRAEGAGEYAVTFVLRRQWEKEAVDSRTLRVKVN